MGSGLAAAFVRPRSHALVVSRHDKKSSEADQLSSEGDPVCAMPSSAHLRSTCTEALSVGWTENASGGGNPGGNVRAAARY
jgi:hypothetical protein